MDFPNSLEYIGEAAFGSCSGLTTVNIPNSVTFIGASAFKACSNLTEITLSENISAINQSTFYDCRGLTSITIPNSVISIGESAFSKCSGLTSVTIEVETPFAITEDVFDSSTCTTATLIVPSGSKAAYQAMKGWNKFSTIIESGPVGPDLSPFAVEIDGIYYRHDNVSEMYLDTYGVSVSNPNTNSNPPYYSGDVVIPSEINYRNETWRVRAIEAYAFQDCYNLTSISFPEPELWGGIENIGNSAFSNCSGLTSITIPNSVTTIGQDAFGGCSGLTSFTIPNSVTTIGQIAFNNCSGLTSITIPNSVATIEAGTFYGCSGLTSVTIPNSVTKIDFEAFSNCSGLSSVTIEVQTPFTISEDVFDSNTYTTATLIVPKGSKAAYQATEGWKKFSKIKENGEEDDEQQAADPVLYKLTYVVDGTAYKTYDVESGATIAPEAEPTKEGYTFSGWSEIPQTMPDHDVTVAGSFTVNKYKLTYMVDGAEYKSYEVEYGASITPEAEPTKEGYTFSGWSDIPQTMPANDVTVTGSFELTSGTFTLTYVVDGETYKSVSYDYGVTIEPEAEPMKEGYTFSGWSEIPQTMPARDVTVSGYFSVNTYTLTYMVDDEVYKTYEIEYGSTITPEEEPTKDDYIFSGWSDIPETMPAEDVTVTGYFMFKTYVLTYIVDDETYKTITYEYGEAITPEAEPTKEGYTFSGWSEIPETMPANDLTVTGSFTVNKYKLVYQVDGDVYKTYEVEYGATITAENEPTKEGYTFSGWSEIPEKMPAEDVTVTGTFTINKYKLTYMVDGEEYKSFEIEYGTAITPEDELTKEGYTFSGWSEIPSTMPADDVAVTGTFTVNKYKLIYMVDGKEYKAYEVEYGSSITPETDPTKEGYIFSGWDNVPETMPANDVTVSGTFTIGTYTLTYLVDGEEYKTISYEYGAAITAENEPTKEGYTFSGWSDIPSTMPGNNITVTGTFTVNKYKLTYTVDGEEYKSFEVDYGSSITPEKEPSKDGYIFSGWSKIPSTMPAHDVEITGKFTPLINVVDDVTYEITGGGTVTVKGGDEKGEVIIEATVEINGQTYFVTAIASNAFKDNKDITSLTIADGITVIGDNAFEGCTGISVINIGKAVLVIGNKAFANVGTSASDGRRRSGGGSLVVNCYAESVPFTASDAFENAPIATGKLLVNDNLVEDYKATAPWSNFGMIYSFNDPSAINAFTIDTENAHIYDIHGNRLDNVRKGVNIIRTRDGKTKKVMVK